MASTQPFVDHIHVDAVWNGVPSSPLTLQISLDVVAKSTSHLSLIRNDHPSVLSANVASISKMPFQNATLLPTMAPTMSSTRDPPGGSKAFGSPKRVSRSPFSADQYLCGRLGHEKGQVDSLLDVHTRQRAHIFQNKNTNHSVLSTPTNPLARPAEIMLFSPTASLFKDINGRDDTLSPPPPLTPHRLTVPKRESLEPNRCHISDQQLPTAHRTSPKVGSSTQSNQRRPISLDKRPPWKPFGSKYKTQRGRKELGTDLSKRRISRSVGTLQTNQDQMCQRRSSLPGRMRKTERRRQTLPGGVRQNDPPILARGNITGAVGCDKLRDRDSTVKVTRYADALNASERLEKWLQDRRNRWPAENSSSSEIAADDDRSICLLSPGDSSGPALSPSPTPSSCVALPWTSVRGIRGGGSMEGRYSVEVGEAPIPTLVEDNGTIFVFFQGYSTGDSGTARFRIQIDASVKLEAQHSGCHSLEIPGLPIQSGNAKGILILKIKATESPCHDNYKAYEKVAYVEHDFSTHPLRQEQMSYTFRLDKPFIVKLLCFEACHALQPSDFEVDSDIHTRYDWENLDGDGITAEHSMICLIRLHPFLLWAETVEFKLYLAGGPSGLLESSLEPGNRRIYLCGKRCHSEHELEICLTCPVADLHKAFTISWEQSFGTVPAEAWLPRISGLHRQKLDDIFDLPRETSIALFPRPCQKPRVYSMIAQEERLKSGRNIFFFPENQHTPGTIQQSLTEQSGQFYDELIGGDRESISTSPVNEGRMTPFKYARPVQHPKKRPRTGQTNFLKREVSGRDVSDRAGHPTYSVRSSEHRPKATRPKEASLVKQRCHGSEQSFLSRLCAALLRALGWSFTHFATPARLLKTIIMMWLFFRAFDHETVVQLEQSLALKAKEPWCRWDFEPVRLYGDITGWKHLMAKANRGAARVLHDEQTGILRPLGLRQEGERKEREGQEREKASAEAEDSAMMAQKPDQSVLLQEDFKRSSSSPRPDKASGKSLTWLDRIDLALGWRPPMVDD